MGVAGALFLGIIVFFINVDHGYMPATTAALKQGVYTFFMGGLIMKLCENLSIRFENRSLSIFLGIIIPVIVTTLATFLVHSLRGTPEPVNSTIPTVVFGIPSFSVWAIRKRKQLEILNEKKL
jgi:hypothetical protein